MILIGPATSSGEKTDDAVICARPGYLHGFELLPPSAGTVTLKIYDSENSTVSGKTVLAQAKVAAGQNSVYCAFLVPRVANRGIFAEVDVTTSSYTVAYSLG